MTTSSEPNDWAPELARALTAASPRAEALDDARARLANGQGEALFEALFDSFVRDDDRAAAVLTTMEALERLMARAADVGGYLMARLYPVASRYKTHATYDSIDLWMGDATSAALADRLVDLSREGVRPKLQQRYEGWAREIRARAPAPSAPAR